MGVDGAQGTDRRADEGGITLYHCRGARSFRALWMLEELELPYRLHLLPFPPRFREPEFLAINPLGTIPFLRTPGGVGMTESAAIVEYLASLGDGRLAIGPDDAGYPRYLNFLHMSDATLTFPQTIYLRYTQLEPEERRNAQAAEDYRRWFAKRLEVAMTMFAGDHCCGDRFTAADIAIGYAIKLARTIGLSDALPPEATRYFARLEDRGGYRRAVAAERS